jgi:hypothetical protein
MITLYTREVTYWSIPFSKINFVETFSFVLYLAFNLFDTSNSSILNRGIARHQITDPTTERAVLEIVFLDINAIVDNIHLSIEV